MRIIAGTRKGLHLKVPAGHAVRPTPDRVREALMSILGGRFHGEAMLDLFAGSGAVGLECASRGCGRVVLVDSGPQAIAALRHNLASVGDGLPVELLTVPAERALAELKARGQRFDLVYIDPPYDAGLESVALSGLLRHGLLSAQAEVWVETQHDALEYPEGYDLVDVRRYGRVRLHGLRPQEPTR